MGQVVVRVALGRNLRSFFLSRSRFVERPDVSEATDAAGFLFAASVWVCGFDDVAICQVARAAWTDSYGLAEPFIIPKVRPMPEYAVELRPVRLDYLVARGTDHVEFLDGTHF